MAAQRKNLRNAHKLGFVLMVGGWLLSSATFGASLAVSAPIVALGILVYAFGNFEQARYYSKLGVKHQYLAFGLMSFGIAAGFAHVVLPTLIVGSVSIATGIGGLAMFLLGAYIYNKAMSSYNMSQPMTSTISNMVPYADDHDFSSGDTVRLLSLPLRHGGQDMSTIAVPSRAATSDANHATAERYVAPVDFSGDAAHAAEQATLEDGSPDNIAATTTVNTPKAVFTI